MTIKWLWVVVLAGAGPLAGCGDDTSGGGSNDKNPGGAVDTTNFCDRWAESCPKDPDPGDVDQCKEECEVQQMMTQEHCWFHACALETGYCDNEEGGDDAILDCAAAHGWK